MTNPTLPFALVNFLARISEERAKLPIGPVHIGAYAQSQKSVESVRFQIESDADWNQVLKGALNLYNARPVNSMTFTYSDKEITTSDVGIILERNKPPMVFIWDFSPKFNMWLVEDEETINRIKNGEGAKEIQELMNRDVGYALRVTQRAN